MNGLKKLLTSGGANIMNMDLIVQILVGLGTAILSFIGIILGNKVAMWVNKRKVPAEVNKIEAETELTEGEIVEKYQAIAIKQADEYTKLAQEKQTLKMAMETKIKELEDKVGILEKKVDLAIRENEELREHNVRLIHQLMSWGITPVPQDVEKAKEDFRRMCIEGDK